MKRAEEAKKNINALDCPEIVEWEVDNDTFHRLV